jgi:hypothetical protein
MAKNTFVEKEPAGYVRLWNDTGAALVAGEFAIIGGIGAIAQEAIADAAYGGFVVGDGLVFQTDTLTTGEKTFATPNQDVYWDDTGKAFSDTKTVGYFKVGQLAEVIASGVIRVLKDYKVEAVPTFAALADVDVAGVTDNDTLKYVASTAKWTDVAV